MVSHLPQQLNINSQPLLQAKRPLQPRIALFFICLCIFLVTCMTDPHPCHADFTIVVYPDSHVDSGTTNLPIWQTQNSWVVDNISARNIVAVLGVGDIVTHVFSLTISPSHRSGFVRRQERDERN